MEAQPSQQFWFGWAEFLQYLISFSSLICICCHFTSNSSEIILFKINQNFVLVFFSSHPTKFDSLVTVWMLQNHR